MRKFIIMGVQGSGKGTQAMLMAADLELEHISVGDIFRWNVQHHTKLGAQVKRTMNAGELVGDDLVESVVRDRLAEHDWNYGFIIDGFPRNARQAEFFLETYDIDGVINLDMPEEDVMQRVLARRLCSECGLDYNLIASRPEKADTCDVCGGKLHHQGRRQPRGAEGSTGDVLRGDQAPHRHLRAQGVRGHHRCHQAGGGSPGRHPAAVRAPARYRLTAHPARSGGRRPAYSTWALIRSRVVRMPLRLVRPRAHPRMAQ